MVNEIYSLASELCGEESVRLEKICQLVKVKFENMLKDDITPQSCSEIFVAACAAKAAVMFSEIKSASNGVTSFSAGNISIGQNAQMREMKEFSLMTAELLSPYLKDEKFDFRGV